MANPTATQFDATTIVESMKPILDANIQAVRALTPRQPRTAAAITVTIPAGGSTRALGVDLSRVQFFVSSASVSSLYMCTSQSSAIETAARGADPNNVVPGFLLPSTGGYLMQCLYQGEVWFANAGAAGHAVSIYSETYGS